MKGKRANYSLGIALLCAFVASMAFAQKANRTRSAAQAGAGF